MSKSSSVSIAHGQTPRATRREWIGLAVIALPCLLYSMDLTVLNLALPHLSADLRPSSSELLWIVDIYGFLVAGSLITMGALGDRIGRRRLLLIGAAAFGIGSVLAAFSTSARMLIATRALLIAQYLQLVLGLEPLPAGLWTVPSMLAYIAGSFLVPRIVRRVRPAYVMSAGMLVAAVGFGLLTQVDGPAGLAVIVAGSVIYSLGLSPVVILATDLIVGSAPVERAGAASAISETSSELGGALGIAILGSVGTAAYRLHVADAVSAGLPPEAAAAARATLGGATAVAGRPPDQVGAELLEAARQAFGHAFELTAGMNAVLAIATAILAAVLLRGLRRADEP